jgi:hypothetical protein
MKLNKNLLQLKESLESKSSKDYDLLIEQLHKFLNPTLKLELKNFLKTGLVSENIEYLFKPRYYFNSKINNFELKLTLMTLRSYFVKQFGFVLLNNKLLDICAIFLKNKFVCEIGAGTGWLSYQLQKRGINIIPIDYKPCHDSDFGFKKLHTQVLVMNGIDYLKSNFPEVVILSWPNYNTSFAYDILSILQKGQTLIYIGEEEGGCTADYAFFELLNKKTQLNEKITHSLQKESLCWNGIHDTWYVFDIK